MRTRLDEFAAALERGDVTSAGAAGALQHGRDPGQRQPRAADAGRPRRDEEDREGYIERHRPNYRARVETLLFEEPTTG